MMFVLGYKVKASFGIGFILLVSLTFKKTSTTFVKYKSNAMTLPLYKVFISHSSTDTWVVKQIQSYIDKLNTNTFLDEGCIDFGDDIENIILKELRTSNELLVLLTPWSLKRPYIWMEIGAAWGLGMRVVGVTHGVSFEDLNPYPALLKKTNLIQLNDMEKYFEQLKIRINNHGE